MSCCLSLAAEVAVPAHLASWIQRLSAFHGLPPLEMHRGLQLCVSLWFILLRILETGLRRSSVWRWPEYKLQEYKNRPKAGGFFGFCYLLLVFHSCGFSFWSTSNILTEELLQVSSWEGYPGVHWGTLFPQPGSLLSLTLKCNWGNLNSHHIELEAPLQGGMEHFWPSAEVLDLLYFMMIDRWLIWLLILLDLSYLTFGQIQASCYITPKTFRALRWADQEL